MSDQSKALEVAENEVSILAEEDLDHVIGGFGAVVGGAMKPLSIEGEATHVDHTG